MMRKLLFVRVMDIALGRKAHTHTHTDTISSLTFYDDVEDKLVHKGIFFFISSLTSVRQSSRHDS